MIYAIEFLDENEDVVVITYNTDTKITIHQGPILKSTPNFVRPAKNEVFFNLVVEEQEFADSDKYRQELIKLGTVKSEDYADAYIGINEEIKDSIRSFFEELIETHITHNTPSLS